MENNKIHWGVGDTAICVDNGVLYINQNAKGIPQLRKGSEYIVSKVRICECGATCLDVGLAVNSTKGTRCKCGAVSMPNTGIHWCASERFVKKRTIKQVEYELNAALDCEEFKLAQNLQDELDKMKEDEKVS